MILFNLIFFTDSESIRMFTCKKLRYVWDANMKMFIKVKSLGPGLPTSMFNQMDAQQGFAGLTVVEQLKRLETYFLLNLDTEFIMNFSLQTGGLWSKLHPRSSKKCNGASFA